MTASETARFCSATGTNGSLEACSDQNRGRNLRRQWRNLRHSPSRTAAKSKIRRDSSDTHPSWGKNPILGNGPARGGHKKAGQLRVPRRGYILPAGKRVISRGRYGDRPLF